MNTKRIVLLGLLALFALVLVVPAGASADNAPDCLAVFTGEGAFVNDNCLSENSVAPPTIAVNLPDGSQIRVEGIR